VLPLPPRPTGFPAPATKARLWAPELQPQRSAADTAWRYRFRQKWRREQLRAMLDGPDNSPDADSLHGRSLASLDEEAGMVFHLEGVTAVAAQQQQTGVQRAPPNGRQASGAAAWSAAAVLSAAPPLAAAAMAPPPPPLPESTNAVRPAANEQAADALQGALAGLLPVRKAVMRGRGSGAGGGGGGGRIGPVAKAGPVAAATGGAGAWGLKAPAPLERDWVPPGWTSPARASQAA
jgi:hypothetical protein